MGEPEATRLYNALWAWRFFLHIRRGTRFDLDFEYGWIYRKVWGLEMWMVYHNKLSK